MHFEMNTNGLICFVCKKKCRYIIVHVLLSFCFGEQTKSCYNWLWQTTMQFSLCDCDWWVDIIINVNFSFCTYILWTRLMTWVSKKKSLFIFMPWKCGNKTFSQALSRSCYAIVMYQYWIPIYKQGDRPSLLSLLVFTKTKFSA